jgi:hypothetical protein
LWDGSIRRTVCLVADRIIALRGGRVNSLRSGRIDSLRSGRVDSTRRWWWGELSVVGSNGSLS